MEPGEAVRPPAPVEQPDRPRVPSRPDRRWPYASWGWLELIPVAAMPFGIALVGEIVVLGMFGWSGPGGRVLASLVQQVALGAGVWWWVKVRTGSAAALGLWRGGWRGGDVAIGAAVGFGAMLLSAAIILVTMFLVERVTGELPGPDNPLDSFPDAWFGPVAVLAVGFAPICEEIAFRGFLFGGLRRAMRFRWAALVSGALFGLVHADPIRFVGLSVTGIILAGLYERRRTLVAPIAAHFTVNLIAVLSLLAYR
jgi:membrane protease YdiL (CAAX protease family)